MNGSNWCFQCFTMTPTVGYVAALFKSCILTVTAILPGAQDPLVFTYNGPVKGTRLFISEAGTTIAAFLGVPYAQPPVEHLRFAIHMIYQNTPVLVFFEGENFAFGSTHRIPGHDLSADGLIIVSVGYRLNVFGFLCFGDAEARGNLGLLDQYLAMRWVQENINKFGGDVNKVTVMGHSSGAASIMYHLVSPRTKQLFQSAIMMSGCLTSPIAQKSNTQIIEASFQLAKSLGCYFPHDTKLVVRCLRTKSAFELLDAYGKQNIKGNSDVFLPVIDSFLPASEQYLSKSPLETLEEGSFMKIPLLTGIVDYDGVAYLARWPARFNDGYFHLHQLFIKSVIPTVLLQKGFTNDNGVKDIAEILKWYYLKDVEPGDVTNIIDRMAQFYSDSLFKAPHYAQLKLLEQGRKNSNAPIFTYEFSYPSLNVYQQSLNLSGLGHGEELIYLFGKSFAREVLGRDFTVQEEIMSATMRKIWYDFIKNGFIHHNNHNAGSMNWEFHHKKATHHFIFQSPDFFQLKRGEVSPRITNFEEGVLKYSNARRISLWNDFLPKFYNSSTHVELSKCESIITRLSLQADQPYRSVMYTLLGLVIVLLSFLTICIILLKRTKTEKDLTFFRQQMD
ncbi:pyrethroid hydrolase Ces2a isoform X2 [Bemisia tabaci]|uniref:pyrethroid hydrolase Ces2a isoform X2 n=1 Tax=Bemisia tabaci TaxID=7038 RepID=UPI003B281A5F